MPNAVREELESIFAEYERDDEDTLRALVERTHDVLWNNIRISSVSGAPNRPSEGTTIKTGTVIARSSQELLNDIVEQLDILLIETLIDTSDIERFDLVKRDLRELFTTLTKEISSLKNEVGTLKVQLSRIEIMETNASIIQMGHIANQLRNKMIRFIKPTLSIRAARDEYLQSVQSEKRFADLTNLIQTHDPTMTVFDVARSITALTKQSATKAHDEKPMPIENIEEVLCNYVSSTDRYLGEQAKIVVRYLKILAQNLREPLIVDLG